MGVGAAKLWGFLPLGVAYVTFAFAQHYKTLGTDLRTAERSVMETLHKEVPNDPWMPGVATASAEVTAHSGLWTRGRFQSTQVNVDEFGNNIIGDAANEPSIAIDPTDPGKIVIGWRQFDTIKSDFRQAGWAYSHDAGQTWTFPGVVEPGQFRSDPVLAADADGNIYFYSIRDAVIGYGDLFKSIDSGVSWLGPIPAFGGDKPWMAIDVTDGIGRGNIYVVWRADDNFTRSTDGGATFMTPIPAHVPGFQGTLSVDSDGTVYVISGALQVVLSEDAQDPEVTPTFLQRAVVDLGGPFSRSPASRPSPNPGGLLGQPWIVASAPVGACQGYRDFVYVLSSEPITVDNPLEVRFARGTERGRKWSPPVRVNDDPKDNGAYHWFAMMSVAPNGRIDAVWNDTRDDATVTYSELYYSCSVDAGRTWSRNVPVSPPFNHFLGYPGGNNKLGDYYHMISDNLGASVAYAATFNGEQDVFFLRIAPDCNENGTPDDDDITENTSADLNENAIPDECEPDLDGDGTSDGCDDDMDGDGVANESDACPFAPLGTLADANGRPISDLNLNCTVDLDDYEGTTWCLEASGPGTPASEGCRRFHDTDLDTDVDLKDFAEFQRAFGVLGR